MYRKAINQLEKWASKPGRKPLIINGARQIGKSWTVRQLGKIKYAENYVEINFEKTPQLSALFEQDLNVSRIVQELEVLLNVSISNRTLLFFDEIQQCPKAIVALRYFYEDLPQLHVIAAGSLLEFQLKDISFPVGRVELLDMFPMDFEEFLRARDREPLLKYIFSPQKTTPQLIEQKIYKELLNYFWVGGMPACVYEFVHNENYREVRKIQQDLLYTFQQDFSSYNPMVNRDCLLDILDNVSLNVGSQIIYTKLSNRFTLPTIKKGFEVLSTAKLIYKVSNVSVQGLPFSKTGKQFKALFLDIGLLLCRSNVAWENLFHNKDINSNFSGSWAEQFVGQQLLCGGYNPLYFWARMQKNSSAEVDFVIEKNGEIIPIEVKSGRSGKLRSMHLLLKENQHVKKGIVMAKVAPGNEGALQFMPIYHAVNLGAD
jgi:predicted AAA+ superfamily ATPase